MFNNTRKVLDEFEKTYNNLDHDGRFPTEDEEDILLYFNMHLAKALMQDEYIGAESVAKIILAAKNLSSEITVKVK
jgi:hypothetical protein